MAGAGPDEEVVKSAVPLVDLSAVEEALKERINDAPLKAALNAARPADLGRELSRLPTQHGRRIAEALDDRRAAAMLRSAHPSVAAKVLQLMARERAAGALHFMPLDAQAQILGTLSAEERAFVTQGFKEPEKKQVERLLSHPELSVARLMTPKVWRVERTITEAPPITAPPAPTDAAAAAANGASAKTTRRTTAGDAMALLRDKAVDIEVGANCYVVEPDGKLVGVVALRELAVAAPDRAVEDLMVKDPIAVTEGSDRATAAEIIAAHNFLSLPVVDAERKLVGAVTVDDLLDAALAKAGTGFLNQGGVSGKVAGALPYFQTPISRVVRSRVTWLVLLFVAETATGTVLRAFEHELDKHVQLAFFIPLLIGTGGNAGSQTVSTIIRALALGEVLMRDALRVLWKEVATGFLLGLIVGAIAFVRAEMWGVGGAIAASVAITILVVCTWANFVGSMIPIGAQRVGIDPTVISGPLITTLVDASGLLIYLTIAMTILGMTAHPVPG